MAEVTVTRPSLEKKVGTRKNRGSALCASERLCCLRPSVHLQSWQCRLCHRAGSGGKSFFSLLCLQLYTSLCFCLCIQLVFLRAHNPFFTLLTHFCNFFLILCLFVCVCTRACRERCQVLRFAMLFIVYLFNKETQRRKRTLSS